MLFLRSTVCRRTIFLPDHNLQQGAQPKIWALSKVWFWKYSEVYLSRSLYTLLVQLVIENLDKPNFICFIVDSNIWNSSFFISSPSIKGNIKTLIRISFPYLLRKRSSLLSNDYDFQKSSLSESTLQSFLLKPSTWLCLIYALTSYFATFKHNSTHFAVLHRSTQINFK